MNHSHLRVVWTDEAGKETVIADTKEGYRVLETRYVLSPTSLRSL